MGLVDKVRGGGQIFFIRLKFSFLLKDQFKNKFFWNDFEQQQKWPGSGLPGQPATGAGGFPLLHLLWTFLCLQSATIHWKSLQGKFSVYCTMYDVWEKKCMTLLQRLITTKSIEPQTGEPGPQCFYLRQPWRFPRCSNWDSKAGCRCSGGK